MAPLGAWRAGDAPPSAHGEPQALHGAHSRIPLPHGRLGRCARLCSRGPIFKGFRGINRSLRSLFIPRPLTELSWAAPACPVQCNADRLTLLHARSQP